jgi:transcription antitermination factor NusG
MDPTTARIVATPMGFSGFVEDLRAQDRVSVLLDLFGRKTTVLLRETELTAA